MNVAHRRGGQRFGNRSCSWGGVGVAALLGLTCPGLSRAEDRPFLGGLVDGAKDINRDRLDAQRRLEEEARRLNAERLEIQRRLEEEARRLNAERLEIQRRLEEEARRLNAERLEVQRRLEEEERRLNAGRFQAQQRADEEIRRLNAERLDAQRTLEAQLASLPMEGRHVIEHALQALRRVGGEVEQALSAPRRDASPEAVERGLRVARALANTTRTIDVPFVRGATLYCSAAGWQLILTHDACEQLRGDVRLLAACLSAVPDVGPIVAEGLVFSAELLLLPDTLGENGVVLTGTWFSTVVVPLSRR